jgi:hypothetical protein
VYAQCVQLGMPRSRSIALEGRLMDCLHGLPLQRMTCVREAFRVFDLLSSPVSFQIFRKNKNDRNIFSKIIK